MTLVCITNDVPELRPCVVHGEHAAHCTGFSTRFDRDTGRREMTNYECGGCLPVPAEHGMLCWSCWEKWQDALKVAVDVITHLRSVERAAQLDNAGVRSAAGWVLPIPSTWRAADDLIVLAGHPTPGFPASAGPWEVEAIAERFIDAIDAAVWASRVDTAVAAVRFNQDMHSALIQHPMEDYEHRIRNVRCPECKRKSLLWKPPLLFRGEVRVVCTNADCAFVLDQTRYIEVTALELLEVQARVAVERKKASAAKRASAGAARKATTEEAKRQREDQR